LEFNKIVPTNRTPKQFNNYEYIIDISSCIFYDCSNNIIYDASNNIIFYNHNYYKNYFIMCINNVSITTENDNYVYLFLLNEKNNIPLCKIGYSYEPIERQTQLQDKLKRYKLKFLGKFKF
jgi:hypothetical protein